MLKNLLMHLLARFFISFFLTIVHEGPVYKLLSMVLKARQEITLRFVKVLNIVLNRFSALLLLCTYFNSSRVDVYI